MNSPTWKDSALYQEHYRACPNYDTQGLMHVRLIRCLMRRHHLSRVFDFGCGQNFLLLKSIAKREPGAVLCGYDCGVPDDRQTDVLRNTIDFQFSPHLLVSTDCLEHIPIEELAQCWSIWRQLAPKYIFAVISTRPSVTRLPDGTPAHKTIKSAEWWEHEMSRNLPDHFIESVDHFRGELFRECYIYGRTRIG